MDFDKSAGNIVRHLRQEARFSQAELAQRLTENGLPIHQQTIFKIENGSRPLRLEEALRIADLTQHDFQIFEKARVHHSEEAKRALSDMEAAHQRFAEELDRFASSWVATIFTLFEVKHYGELLKGHDDVLESMTGKDSFAISVMSELARVQNEDETGWLGHDPNKRFGEFVEDMDRFKRIRKVVDGGSGDSGVDSEEA